MLRRIHVLSSAQMVSMPTRYWIFVLHVTQVVVPVTMLPMNIAQVVLLTSSLHSSQHNPTLPLLSWAHSISLINSSEQENMLYPDGWDGLAPLLCLIIVHYSDWLMFKLNKQVMINNQEIELLLLGLETMVITCSLHTHAQLKIIAVTPTPTLKLLMELH